MKHLALFENFDADKNIIMPYLELARTIIDDDTRIMDSPIVYPRGYDGDVYFTYKNNNGTFDTLQLEDGKVILHRDLEDHLKDGDEDYNNEPLEMDIEKFRKYILNNNGK